MIRTVAAAGVLLASLWGTSGQSSSALSVEVDEAAVSTEAGTVTPLVLTITNERSDPTGPLIAHLLVVDPIGEVSADAEDWTDQLTRRVDSLDLGEVATVEWDVKSIKSGEYFVMFAIAPLDPAVAPPAVSSNVVFSVSPPGGLTSTSVIFVSLLVPAVVAGADLMVRRRKQDKPVVMS